MAISPPSLPFPLQLLRANWRRPSHLPGHHTNDVRKRIPEVKKHRTIRAGLFHIPFRVPATPVPWSLSWLRKSSLVGHPRVKDHPKIHGHGLFAALVWKHCTYRPSKYIWSKHGQLSQNHFVFCYKSHASCKFYVKPNGYQEPFERLWTPWNERLLRAYQIQFLAAQGTAFNDLVFGFLQRGDTIYGHSRPRTVCVQNQWYEVIVRYIIQCKANSFPSMGQYRFILCESNGSSNGCVHPGQWL